jgi:hypothetical protein
MAAAQPSIKLSLAARLAQLMPAHNGDGGEDIGVSGVNDDNAVSGASGGVSGASGASSVGDASAVSGASGAARKQPVEWKKVPDTEVDGAIVWGCDCIGPRGPIRAAKCEFPDRDLVMIDSVWEDTFMYAPEPSEVDERIWRERLAIAEAAGVPTVEGMGGHDQIAAVGRTTGGFSVFDGGDDVDCSGCGKPIVWMTPTYSNDDGGQYCFGCKTETMTKHPADDRGVGSIRDWRPVFADEEEHGYVMSNVNVNSPYFGRLGIAVCGLNSGSGWWTLPEDANLAGMIETYKKNLHPENDPEEDSYWGILAVCDEFDIPTDYS